MDQAGTDLGGQVRRRRGTSQVPSSCCVDCLSALPAFPVFQHRGKGGRFSSIGVDQRHLQLGEITLLGSPREESVNRAGGKEKASVWVRGSNRLIDGDHTSSPGVLILSNFLGTVKGQAGLGGKIFWVELAADEEKGAADVFPVV